MEPEKTLISALKGVFPAMDVFHDFAPDNAAAPFAVLQRVGGAGGLYLGGVGAYQIRFQLSVWADTRVQAADISRRAENALCTLPRVCADGAGLADYDADTGLRGLRQDFLVFLEAV